MGAHRTSKCDRCEFTATGSKRDVEQALGLHIVDLHPHVLDAMLHREPSPETTATIVDRQVGHECPNARAITPFHDGYCDWCGRTPKPQYEWYVPSNPQVRPFWVPIKVAA
jgi:hypothetical protein